MERILGGLTSQLASLGPDKVGVLRVQLADAGATAQETAEAVRKLGEVDAMTKQVENYNTLLGIYKDLNGEWDRLAYGPADLLAKRMADAGASATLIASYVRQFQTIEATKVADSVRESLESPADKLAAFTAQVTTLPAHPRRVGTSARGQHLSSTTWPSLRRRSCHSRIPSTPDVAWREQPGWTVGESIRIFSFSQPWGILPCSLFRSGLSRAGPPGGEARIASTAWNGVSVHDQPWELVKKREG